MRPCTYMNVYTEAKVFTFWCVIYSDIFYSSPFCKTNKTKPQRADYPNQLNWSNDSLRVVSLRIEGLRPMSCRIPGCDSQFCWSWKSNLSVYSVTTPTKFLSDLKKKKVILLLQHVGDRYFWWSECCPLCPKHPMRIKRSWPSILRNEDRYTYVFFPRF